MKNNTITDNTKYLGSFIAYLMIVYTITLLFNLEFNLLIALYYSPLGVVGISSFIKN